MTVEGTAADYNAGYGRRLMEAGQMNSLDKMLGWFPHTNREWIELIIMTVLLWLLMMAIFELELA
jgi:hypothetical protein